MWHESFVCMCVHGKERESGSACMWVRTWHVFMCERTPSLLLLLVSETERGTLFVCLFVCWNKTRKTILCLLCWERSKPPCRGSTQNCGLKLWLLSVQGLPMEPKDNLRSCYFKKKSQINWKEKTILKKKKKLSGKRILNKQVDGLARITGLTPAPYKMHPQPPNGVPPWLAWAFIFIYFLVLNPHFLVFGLLCRHTASNSITSETHTSGVQ